MTGATEPSQPSQPSQPAQRSQPQPAVAAEVDDPVARLMLAEAGDLRSSVLVVDDVAGALSRAVLGTGRRVVATCDDIRARQSLPAGVVAVDRLDSAEAAEALADVDTVLWRLPRSLDAVSETAELLGTVCPDRVRVVAGGRDKHMTPTMNPVLARSFDEVHASRGRWKCRVVHASRPIPREVSWPRTSRLTSVDLELVSYGAAFASGRLDAGTALLAAHLPTGSGVALDVGCGTGILTVLLARLGWQVTASDVSLAAVRSTLDTTRANGLSDLTVGWHDGVRGDPGSVDLVVSNPPFHQGGAKDSTDAFAFIAGAGEVLRPGGEMWLVYNAHLPYLPYAREKVGPTRVVARDRSYVVTCSTCT